MRKKTKSKSKTAAEKPAKKRRKKTEAKGDKDTNPAEVRKEISKLVKADAAEMTQAVIGEGKKGQLAPVRYLFEMANIFPPVQDGSEATPEEDCLAKMLLDRLNAADKPAEKADDTGAAGKDEPIDPEPEKKSPEAEASVTEKEVVVTG